MSDTSSLEGIRLSDMSGWQIIRTGTLRNLIYYRGTPDVWCSSKCVMKCFAHNFSISFYFAVINVFYGIYGPFEMFLLVGHKVYSNTKIQNLSILTQPRLTNDRLYGIWMLKPLMRSLVGAALNALDVWLLVFSETTLRHTTFYV